MPACTAQPAKCPVQSSAMLCFVWENAFRKHCSIQSHPHASNSMVLLCFNGHNMNGMESSYNESTTTNRTSMVRRYILPSRLQKNPEGLNETTLSECYGGRNSMFALAGSAPRGVCAECPAMKEVEMDQTAPRTRLLPVQSPDATEGTAVGSFPNQTSPNRGRRSGKGSLTSPYHATPCLYI